MLMQRILSRKQAWGGAVRRFTKTTTRTPAASCATHRKLLATLLIAIAGLATATALPANAAADDQPAQDTASTTATASWSPFPHVDATATHRGDALTALATAPTTNTPAALANTTLAVPWNAPEPSTLANTSTTIGDQPEGDEAYISSLTVENIDSGTAPWDGDDNPGNDSSPDNKIVRSMDAVTYELEYVATPHDDAPNGYYRSARLGFQMVIPTDDDQLMRPDLDSMGWVDTTPGYEPRVDIRTVDGKQCQVVTVYRLLKPTDEIPTSVPGTGTVQFVLDVGFMANRDKVQPYFCAWIEGNQVGDPATTAVSQDTCPQHRLAEAKLCTPDELTVSAAPRYNITVSNSAAGLTQGRGDYDFSTGNDTAPDKDLGVVNGRLYMYGIQIRLQNPSADKQLRGIEKPTGPIEFDLKLSTRISIDSNNFEDIAPDSDFRPLVWSLGASTKSATRENGRAINVNGQSHISQFKTTPLNKRSGDDYETGEGHRACYDGGTWSSTAPDENGVVHVTVSDYEIDTDWFPNTNYDLPNDTATYYPSGGEVRNIGVFSAGDLFVIQPHEGIESRVSALDEFGCTTDASFNVSVADSSMRATSVSGQSLPEVADTSNQVNGSASEDKATQAQAIRRPGAITQYITYTRAVNGQNGGTVRDSGTDGLDYTQNYSRGDDSALVGSNLRILVGMRVIPYEWENIPVGGQYLAKFDPDLVRPTRGITVNDIGMRDSYEIRKDRSRLRVLYAAKPDGSDWTGWNEQLAADFEDLVYFDSLDALENSGAVCLGVLLDARVAGSNRLSWHDSHMTFPIEVTTDASAVGEVAPICACTRQWSRKQLVDTVSADLGRSVSVDTDADAFQQWLDAHWDDMCEDPSMPSLPDPKYVATDHSYIPAYYDSNGYAGGHTAHYQRGDSLYIAGENTKISKTVAQRSGDGAKAVFDMDYQQRYADYELRPTLDTAETNVSSGYSTAVTIRDTLPASLSYVPGSSYLGGTYAERDGGVSPGVVSGGTAVEPVAVRQSDGSTELTWTLQYSANSGDDLPVIHYTCLIGTPGDEATDVVNNQEITNDVTIQSTYDKRVPTSSFGNMDSETIKVSKLRQSSLSVRAQQIYNEVESPLGFVSSTGNYGENPIQNAFSVGLFPFDGDGRSDYSGAWRLSSVKLNKDRNDGVDDVRVFITTDASYRDKNYEDLTVDELDSSKWIELTVNADGTCVLPSNIDLSKVVGWAATDAMLMPDMAISISFELAPTGNEPADVYGVSWTDSDNIVSATSYIIGRSVSGHIFYDKDDNGRYDADVDGLVAGSVVSLVDGSGDTVKNMAGKECRVTVGADGAYLFDDLPAGDFKVVFEPPANTSWDDYHMATKDSPHADDTNDSDADGVLSGNTLIRAEIPDIHMPSAAEMSNATYYLEHMDAGIVPPFGYLELRKVSGNANVTEGNPNYSLGEAVYGIYSSSSCDASSLVAKITTDSSGYAKSDELKYGTYWVKEITAAPGYELDGSVYRVEVEPLETASVNGGSVVELPHTTLDTPKITKLDANTWDVPGASDGAGLAGAEFTVSYYTDTDTSRQASTTPKRVWVFRTDGNGKVAFDDAHLVADSSDPLYTDGGGKAIIPIGSISVAETKAPTGYKLSDEVKRVSITVEVDSIDGWPIIDEPEETSLAITKTWDDDHDRDGLRVPARFTIVGTVAGSGEVVYQKTVSVEATDGDNVSITVGGLPAYANGKPVVYTYTEEKVSGYDQTLGGIGGDWQGGYTASAVNTHRVEMAEYTVKKTWDDDGDRDGLRPSSIDVTLSGSDGSTRSQRLTGGAWSGSFGSLPVYYDHGKPIQYDLTETKVDGYDGSEPVKQEIKDSSGRTTGWELSISNDHEIATRSIGVEKVWDDDSDRDGLRPDSVDITLTGTDGSTRTETATAGNGWKVVFEDLPVYHSHGREIVYTVDEGDVPDGYKLVGIEDASGGGGSSYRITNAHTPEVISIPVEKTWDDDDDRDGVRSDDITVTLTGSDGSKRDATFGAAEGWKYTFTDLPRYFNHGKRIEYTLIETPVDGYTHKINADDTGSSYSFEITNEHIPAVVSIPVTKVWNDNDNQDGMRADSIHVTLTGSDGSVREADFGADVGWSGFFSDLPVYYDHGTVVDYALTEASVDGYETDIVETDDGYGFTVTNTHVPAVRSIAVEKNWDDDDDRDGVRPDSIDVTLTGSDGIERSGSVSADGDWMLSFDDLPVYYDNGTLIEYSLDEQDVPDGYTLDDIAYVPGSGELEQDGARFVVVNRHDPETVDIVVHKRWRGDVPDGSDRPDAVTVDVNADIDETQSGVLGIAGDGDGGDASDWMATLGGRNMRAGGEDIVYSVDEHEIDGYECVEVSGGIPSTYETEDGSVKHTVEFTVTNEKIVEPVSEDLPISPQELGMTDDLARTGDDTGLLRILPLLVATVVSTAAALIVYKRRRTHRS